MRGRAGAFPTGVCGDRYHAQHDLGLEKGFGEHGVVGEDLAGLLWVLLHQVPHLRHDLVQLRPRLVPQKVCDFIP